MGCGASKSIHRVGRFSLEDPHQDGAGSAAPSMSGSEASLQSQGSIDDSNPLSTSEESRLHVVRTSLKVFQGTSQFFDDGQQVSEECIDASASLSRVVSESIVFQGDIKLFLRRVGKLYMDTKTLPVLCELISTLTGTVCDQSEGVHSSIWFTLRVQLSSFRNLTYFDTKFATKTCESGLLKSMAQLLRYLYGRYTDNDVTPKKQEALLAYIQCGLSISNHCAAVGPSTKPFYDKLNYSEVLIPYLKIENDQTKTETMFCLAYILDEENNDVFSSNREHVAYLVKTLKLTLNEEMSLNFTGWTPDVLARGIARMANNDTNKKYLVEEGILPLLITMSKMNNFNCVICATNLMWSLSFHPDNMSRMLAYREFMNNIIQLCKADSRKVRNAAKGCLWTLGRSKSDSQHTEAGKTKAQEDSPVVAEEQSRQHLMISYSWDKKHMIYKIKNELTKAGYSIWLDVEQMEGSTLEAMASAVEKSAVVLVCASEKYKSSNNCRAEAEYAFQKKREIIPLMMERYEPDGWLGIILGTKKFYDFSGKYSFSSRMEGLLQELKDKGRGAMEADIVQRTEVLPVAARPSSAAKNKISSWTTEDVSNWIKEMNIQSDGAFSTIDGKQLNFLQMIRNQAPEFYFQYLQNTLRLDNLKDMMLFDENLRSLH